MRTKSFPTICAICLAEVPDLEVKFFYRACPSREEKVSFWFCPSHSQEEKLALADAHPGYNSLPVPFEQLFTWI